MENRFEHTPPEESQGWGKYATPPPTSGLNLNQTNKLPSLPHDLTMCERVREQLPFLMENADESMPADTARAIYGHLSVCTECSREFDDHQRMVSYLEAMAPVVMPMDFGGVIQRRIQVQSMAAEAVVTPVTPRAFGSPSIANAKQSEASSTISKRVLTTNSMLASTLKKTKISSARQFTQFDAGLVQRVTSSTVMAAIMTFFISSTWGREMLGENIIAIRAWLTQVGLAVGRIPILGRLALLVITALAQLGDLLGSTYRTVGDMAVRGLAMDVGVCIAAYYFLVVRRQRDISWIRRA